MHCFDLHSFVSLSEIFGENELSIFFSRIMFIYNVERKQSTRCNVISVARDLKRLVYVSPLIGFSP